MRKKLPYLLPSFVFFLGAPLVWLLCFREVPLRVSPETTHITQPLTKDGKSIDWFLAIKERFEPKCKPEDNGFRMVAAALGRSPYFDQPDWYWPELCRELDLDPNLMPTLKFEPPIEYINREYLLWLDANDGIESIDDTVKLRERLFSEPWTVEEFPFMARWADENSPMLDLVAEAVRKDFFFVPMLRKSEYEEISVQPQNNRWTTLFPEDFRMAFQCRMRFRLGNGDVDGAWRDAMSLTLVFRQIHRSLSNLTFYQEPIFHEQLDIAKNHTLSSEQRKRLLADLQAMPPPESKTEVILKQRLGNLQAVSAASEMLEKIDSPGKIRYINWNLVTRRINRCYDELDRAAKEPDLSKQDIVLRNFESQLSIHPRRSWLSTKLGKPITVNERSEEFAWSISQGMKLIPAWFFSDKNEQTLTELRKRLEEENHEP